MDKLPLGGGCTVRAVGSRRSSTGVRRHVLDMNGGSPGAQGNAMDDAANASVPGLPGLAVVPGEV